MTGNTKSTHPLYQFEKEIHMTNLLPGIPSMPGMPSNPLRPGMPSSPGSPGKPSLPSSPCRPSIEEYFPKINLSKTSVSFHQSIAHKNYKHYVEYDLHLVCHFLLLGLLDQVALSARGDRALLWNQVDHFYHAFL